MAKPSLTDLLAPQYVDNRTELSLKEIRERRGNCQQAEESLSLQRRIVQGRLDIVQSELYRRVGQSEVNLGDSDDVVNELPSILVEHGERKVGPGRLTSVGGDNHAELDEDFDQLNAMLNSILSPESILELDKIDDAQLRKIANEMEKLERSISQNRHQLHRNIDSLQEEIIRRYKSGEANVDQLLNDNK